MAETTFNLTSVVESNCVSSFLYVSHDFCRLKENKHIKHSKPAFLQAAFSIFLSNPSLSSPPQLSSGASIVILSRQVGQK